jgi:hypothetical protein
MDTLNTELEVNARSAVGPLRHVVDDSDLIQQLAILASPLGWRPSAPRVVAALGDLQGPAHQGDRVVGLARSYESERFLGVGAAS